MQFKLSRNIIFIFFIFVSCKQDNPHIIDVSHIDLDIELKRYEKEFFDLPEDNFEEAFWDFYQQHPVKTELLVEHILGFGRVDDKTRNYVLPLRQHFYNDPYLQELNDDIQEKYDRKKIRQIEDDLSKAFKHVIHYYPELNLPDFYTTLTSFTYNTVTYEDLIGVSLDMYLGQDYKYYPSKSFPQYKMRRMNEHYIVPDVVMSFALMRYPEEEYTRNNLLSKMLHEGKLHYFLDMMLPELHDTMKIQYTADQLAWSESFESKVWEHLVSRDLLFTSERHQIDRYINDGPFTSASGLPHNSSPRLGVWIGWQIVRSYMENHPETTIQELMEMTDDRRLLQASGYKP